MDTVQHNKLKKKKDLRGRFSSHRPKLEIVVLQLEQTACWKHNRNMDLICKPKGKSIVWMYFGLKADEKGQPLNSNEAICRLCRKVVLSKGGNTTNLRSHLRRRHRAEFFEPAPIVNHGALFGLPGSDSNHDELLDDFPFLQTATNQSYVPDAGLPPGEPWLHGGPSRAMLSLPSCLNLCKEVGVGMSASSPSEEEEGEELKVYAKCHLQQGVMFGPYVGEFCRGQMPANLKYAWAVRDDASFVYVDAADENKSNWMRYVTYTSKEEEHNLVIFQFYRHIYYKVSQPITEGAELKVWIGKDYATLLGLGMGDNVKCEYGEKETVLRLLQDIQLVTLPESSSYPLWSDHSQSQSPMPVISDVTTVSNTDLACDSDVASGSALPPFSPSSSFQHGEKYEFLTGTEKLLGNPNVSQHSPWYFFGFEPDPAGRPLDRNTAVCKLCGERVSCGGGVQDLQTHLSCKHHMKAREVTKERSIQTTVSQQRSLGANSSPVNTLPLVLSFRVTNAITNFVISDLQPPAVVEGEGFKQLIHTLLPPYKDMPSMSHLETLLKGHHTRGKMSLVQLMGKKVVEEEIEETDYTAPIDFEPRRRGRPANREKEVPHFITLSADIWFHNWHGNTERYLTLWAHFIDSDFSFQNLALATQRVSENVEKDSSPRAVEAQVKMMAQEWGVTKPNLLLLGGEGRSKMELKKGGKGGEAASGVPHPNSTTFLERDDSVSSEEQSSSEHGVPSDGLPSVPCFFSAVQSCIEEVMSHSVISKTLKQFQGILSTLFLPQTQKKCINLQHLSGMMQNLRKEEQAELKLWAHSRLTWNKLYPALSILLKQKPLLSDTINEIKEEYKDDMTSESSASGSCHANSASSTSSQSLTLLRAEWKVLEDLCLVLKPLDVACRTLAKEAFPRLSLIKPILTGLLSRHLVPRPGDSSSILKEVKRMMRRNLMSSYDSPAVNRVLCVACSLDPQFHGLGFMEEKDQKATFDWLKTEVVRIVNEDSRRSKRKNQSQCKRSSSPETPESIGEFVRRSKRLKESRPINFREMEFEDDESDEEEPDESEEAQPGEQGSGLSGMEFLLGDLFCSAPKSKQSSVEESVDMELSVFRADKGVTLGVEPLQWWRMKAMQFPLLATVARAYLAAPAVAGSAAQEFMQGDAQSIYRKRSNIPPENLDSILFLHHNHISTTEGGQAATKSEDRNSGMEKVS